MCDTGCMAFANIDTPFLHTMTYILLRGMVYTTYYAEPVAYYPRDNET